MRDPSVSLRCLLAVPLVCLGAGGCLGEDRCGPTLRRVGERCVPPDGAGERRADRGVADRGVTERGSGDGRRDGGGCRRLTAAELSGTYQQSGKVERSVCTPPMPVKGDVFDAEVTFFVSDGGGLRTSIKTALLTVVGEASLQADGRVQASAQGDMLGVVFAISEAICFSDLDHGAGAALVKLSTAGTPLCDFDVNGSLTRK